MNFCYSVVSLKLFGPFAGIHYASIEIISNNPFLKLRQFNKEYMECTCQSVTTMVSARFHETENHIFTRDGATG